MTKRPLVTTFGLASLALLCMAEVDRSYATPGDRGNQGRPASAPSRPSPPSRPSAPAQSRPSAPAPSRPSAPPPQSRPSAPSVSRPAASNPAPVSQRPSREQAPVSRPQPTPHYERPQPEPQPRHVEPRPEQPRYDQPRNDGPRYLPPDNSGRATQPERERSGTDGEGLSRGRIGGVAPDAGNPNARVWRPDGGGAYEFERRTPRTPVPTLTGTPRLGGAVAGTPRPGLSSRTGRIPDLGSTSRSTGSAVGEGLVRLPHAEITRESILQRYRGRAIADSVLPKRAPTDNDLSRARGAARIAETTPKFDDRARAMREKAATIAPRGSVEAARRERESFDRLDRLRRDAPWRAKPIEDAGRAVSNAADAAAQIAIGVGVGFGTGVYAGWFWEPSCSPHHNAPYSHWAVTFGWPWSYYGSYWANGPCSYGWPFWGFSWYGHGWNLGWNSCASYPYSYTSYYPYSYSYWSPSPVYYTTVINDYGRDDGGAAVVYEEPQAAGEGLIVANPGGEREVLDLPREQAPEVKAALLHGAMDYLNLGDEAFRQGRYSDAVHHYARTVEYAPDHGVLYLLLSDALFATGDYHYAAFALRRAIELEPNLLDSVIDKHGFYGNPAEYDKQIALAEQYLNEHNLDEDARLILAANYLFAKRPAQCVDLLISPFSRAVLESTAGRRIHDRAEALRKSASPAQK